MPSTFNLTASPTFPQGTSLTAYPRAFWGGPWGPSLGQVPQGAGSISATVDAHGFALFEGLEAEKEYAAGAQIGGVWRWITFRAPVTPPGGGGEVTTAQLNTAVATVNTAIVEAGYVPSSTKAANFTLALADIGKSLDCTKASGEQTVTIPLHASVPFLDGAVIPITRVAGATLLIVPEAGVTLLPTAASYTISEAGLGVVLRKRGAGDNWVIAGSWE